MILILDAYFTENTCQIPGQLKVSFPWDINQMPVRISLHTSKENAATWFLYYCV